MTFHTNCPQVYVCGLFLCLKKISKTYFKLLSAMQTNVSLESLQNIVRQRGDANVKCTLIMTMTLNKWDKFRISGNVNINFQESELAFSLH